MYLIIKRNDFIYFNFLFLILLKSVFAILYIYNFYAPDIRHA